MKKLALLCIAALGSALLVLGTAPSASAYPEVTCDVQVDRQVLNPGETFTATGTAKAVDNVGKPVPSSSIHWTFSWNGVTKERTGSPVQASFTAPQVNHTRHILLTVKATAPQGPCVHTFDITVVGATVDAPGGGGGHLPSTGGPAFWILLAALALLLAGGGSVVVSRRRS